MTSDRERSKWQKRAHRSMVSIRETTWYEAAFNINPDELVLDLGPGHSPYAPDNVMRIDYGFAHKFRPRTGKGRNVAGIFQELPFKDEAYDRVVGSWSVRKLREGALQSVAEILRVVRIGGEIQLTPAEVANPAMAQELVKLGLAKLETIKIPPSVLEHLGAIALPSPAILGCSEPSAGSLIASSTAQSVLDSFGYPNANGQTLTIVRPEFTSNEINRTDFAAWLLGAFNFVARPYTPEPPSRPIKQPGLMIHA